MANYKVDDDKLKKARKKALLDTHVDEHIYDKLKDSVNGVVEDGDHGKRFASLKRKMKQAKK